MPIKTKTESWVKHFRGQLKTFMEPKAPWYVQESRRKIRLIVIEDGKTQTLTLENDWSLDGSTKAINRISLIYKNFYSDLGNRSLERSATVVNKASSKNEIDFDQLMNDFRAYCPTASDATFEKCYVPVLNHAKRLLTSKKKPLDGSELMVKSLEQWKHGGNMWNKQRRAIAKFLEWAVIRGKLSNVYAPVKIDANNAEKSIGYALEDDQILQLIASEKSKQWQYTYQLLAVYGLRPIELKHLVVKKGVKGKELWCMYRKSMGGTKGQKTEPRHLAPLYIEDGKGLINWNLLERVEKKEELPSFGDVVSGGIGKHLSRSKTWQKFKKDAKDLGEEIKPYSFRHRYAKVAYARSVQLNLSTKDICLVMGHTKEVHDQNYARFIPDGTHDKFAKQLVA